MCGFVLGSLLDRHLELPSIQQCRMEETVPPLSFCRVCELLDALERLYTRYQAPGTKLSQHQFRAERRRITRKWVTDHCTALLKDQSTVLATLSLLLPALRADRVYTLSDKMLARVVASAMGMGPKTEDRLRGYRLNERDFGSALERQMDMRVQTV
jgi:hypothetical protein